MNLIVKKFGGTSVTSDRDRERIKNLIEADIKNGNIPVLVVSAMGRNSAPYATDTLINLYSSINDQGSTRDLDLIMSCGEIISATLISAYLNSNGIKSTALTGFQAGIITNEDYGNAKVLSVNTEYLEAIIDKGIIPVISGFQGISISGNITTLGRGGSDTTATLIGEALKVDKVEIYTDVDGVMTADPRIVENATLLENMTYDEMYEMAKHGAKIVDFNAVDIAKRSHINVVVKNTHEDSIGTQIIDSYKSDRIITSITKYDSWIQYKINYKFSIAKDQELMNALHKNNISIDMINFFEDYKYFVVQNNVSKELDDLLKNLNLNFKKKENCSKVTIIGHKIHGVSGIMKRIVKALEDSDIKILQTSDSHMTISCLVESELSNAAVISLHKEFNIES
ncbi:MAG: aspartate kinase [Bacillota bacterium]|nr:aspartate kinase [Bacillota bacterium]